MHIEIYNEKYEGLWEDFVEKSSNGTIFHKRKFLSYHPPKRFVDLSLLFFEKNNLQSIFPGVNYNDFLVSHKGASYGGFIFKENITLKECYEIVETIMDFARKEGLKGIEITFPPLIYYTRPNNYFEFVLTTKGFKFRKRELSSYIPVLEEPFDIFKQEARTAVRKAIKSGAYTMISDDFKTFYHILEKNLSMRHNVKPTHTLEELLKLKKLFPDKIWLNAVFYKEKMIAGTVIFETNSRVALAFYISHDEEYKHLRPVNLLFYETLKLCFIKGFKFLDLGTFTLNMVPNMGLGRFKESLGGRGIFRDTYFIEF